MFCIDFVGLFGSLFKLSIYETRTEQQENSCPERSYLFQKKISGLRVITARSLVGNSFSQDFFLTQKKVSCLRKSFSVTGINFLSQKEISRLRKKFPVSERNFLTQKEIFCLRKKFPVSGRNHIVPGKKILVTGKNSCHRKKFLTS